MLTILEVYQIHIVACIGYIYFPTRCHAGCIYVWLTCLPPSYKNMELGLFRSAWRPNLYSLWKIQRWIDREDKYKGGMSSAYATIMEKYTLTGLISKIKSRTKFETNIQNKPIKLLEPILEVTNETDSSKYPYMTTIVSLTRLLNVNRVRTKAY